MTVTTSPQTESTEERPPPTGRPDPSTTPRSTSIGFGRPHEKSGGVAPFVRPPGRFSRFRSRKGWRRRGFVPLSPGREKRRHRILPRTVIGIATMLMAFGVGAAFSGAAFYAYYDDRLAANEREIARFVEGFDEQFDDASSALDQLRSESVDQIRTEMLPLGDFVSDSQGVVTLPQTIGGSVWAVETTDEAGRPVGGSAFAVTGHQGGTALVTSYSVVRASALSPGPAITLVKGEERVAASLWSWDPANDLALLITEAPIDAIELARPSVQVESVGGRLFAMAGVGGQGSTASPGVLLDHSVDGLQHTAAVGTVFVGGPLVNSDGVVVGVASLDYQPMGIEAGSVGQAPDITAVCNRVLRCADTADPLTGDLVIGDEGG